MHSLPQSNLNISPHTNSDCHEIPLPQRLVHDLIQPLNAVSLLVAELQDHLDDDEFSRGLLAQIRYAVNAEEALLNSLRLYLRIISGQFSPILSPRNLDNVVPAAVADFSSRFPDLEIELEGMEECYWVQTDHELLPEILLRLLDNAGAFAQRRVSISCRRIPGASNIVNLVIRDDGQGIPEHVAERLGTSFIRAAHKQLRKRQGLGLGVFIASSLSERLDHHLSFTRTEQWTEFSLKLKASPRPVEVKSAELNMSSAFNGDGLAIYILGDTTTQLLDLRIFLENLGHTVFLEIAAPKKNAEVNRPSLFITTTERLPALIRFLDSEAPELRNNDDRIGIILLQDRPQLTPDDSAPHPNVLLKRIALPLSPSRLRATIDHFSRQIAASPPR